MLWQTYSKSEGNIKRLQGACEFQAVEYNIMYNCVIGDTKQIDQRPQFAYKSPSWVSVVANSGNEGRIKYFTPNF